MMKYIQTEGALVNSIGQVVSAVAPKAQIGYLKAFYNGAVLFREAGITTPLRVAHFLAQVLHESGGLTIAFENMNYRAPRIMEIFGVGRHSAAVTKEEAAKLAGNPQALAERVYGLGNPRKARELGNTQPGDGYKYRGGGILQTTGKAAYKKWGDKIGVDLVGNPEFICRSDVALKPAIMEWVAGGCNELADKNDISAITKKINGGYNGLKDRKARFDNVYPLCNGRVVASGDEAWKDAEVDSDCLTLQRHLNALGYEPKLKEDGKRGPATKAAIEWFQKANRLKVDGVAGAITTAAIQKALTANKADPLPVATVAETATSKIGGGSILAGGAGVAGVASQVWDHFLQVPDSVMQALIGATSKPSFWIFAAVIAVAGVIFYVVKKEVKT
jgi:putative chitinase